MDTYRILIVSWIHIEYIRYPGGYGTLPLHDECIFVMHQDTRRKRKKLLNVETFGKVAYSALWYAPTKT